MPKAPSYVTTGDPGEQKSMLDWALDWAERGWPVFPLKPNDKIPLFGNPHKNQTDDRGKPVRCDGRCGLVGHGVLDATRDPEKIRKWWTQNPKAGIGGSTDGRVVFDFDIQHGAKVKGSFPTSRKHLSGRGNGNFHQIYRVGGSVAGAQGPGANVLGKGIDVRAGAGAYVVLPPSIHPEGGPYEVDDSSVPEHSLTDEDMAEIWSSYGVGETATAKGARAGLSVVTGDTKSAPGAPGAQKLSDLLGNPPERGEGSTNDWLTRVAGHYAKMHRDKRDLYETQVRLAAALVDPDYEDTEKVLESVWGKESVDHPERDASEANGYLVGNGVFLLASGKDGDGEMELQPWADFDIRVVGVMVDADDRRSYQITLTARGKEIETTLSPEILVDTRKRNAWLARYGVSIAPRMTCWPQMDAGARLVRYLESQRAGEVRVVEHLGWDGTTQQFVTFDGAIRPSGTVDIRTAGVIVDRARLEKSKVKQNYGFEGTWEEAQAVLREVQDYHFEEVTRPMAAWWAATLLKPQTLDLVSVFPYCALEAASGSAKTNGYVGMMVQLNGNHLGQVVPTTASFRDTATTNHSGIVWADDLNNPERLQEILRASSSGGTVRKMGEDRKTQDAVIVNPLLFTGEALGLNGQKALLERGFLMQVNGDVTKRENAAGEPQWNDIVALQKRYRGDMGLTVLSGWYVQKALSYLEQYEVALKELRKGTGRRGDKFAVLRAGARLFDALLGEENAWEGAGQTAQWVDPWVEAEVKASLGVENDNAITLKLLPWAIRQWGEIKPEGNVMAVDYRGSKNQAPPVLVESGAEDSLEDPEVWVNTARLARAWYEAENGRIDERLESEAGLAAQLQQIAYDKAVRRFKKVNGVSTAYRQLLPEYARLVLARVTG
ncbi:DNA primase/polymerase [Microbacterium phage Theresita]|nr:DNA primase/polymerase [Microbacterium phage Theresita]